MSYRVVGYRDLRPVDWASGKRMPLPAGEGHVCDRCGAEHAVVYAVLDDETGKTYQVGSSCARRQFGFDVDRASRSLVKEARARTESELDAARQLAAAEVADAAVARLSGAAVPELVADRDRYPGTVAWRCGDALALAAHGRTDAEAREMAVREWVCRRVSELVPTEARDAELLRRPGTKDRTRTLFRQKVEDLAVPRLLGGKVSRG